MTLNRTDEEPKRVKRWPDVLGVGMPKCGTGTLAFFDCHSKIVFREAEANFWYSLRVQLKHFASFRFSFEGTWAP